ncbi:MAG: patatin-like phospholipase family protein [Burkholderiaceae bacterium]
MIEPAPAGLVLSGGGARAAYQAGALRAVAAILGKHRPRPFAVICGTSAGAINAAALATHADDFRRGVARLLRWWRRIDVADVYRADFATLSRHGVRFLAAMTGVGRAPPNAASMLDNAPLAQLLARAADLDRIAAHIASGALAALGINATSYNTGQAVTFFESAAAHPGWKRTRRRGEPATLTVAHLMASTAIPFIFPAVRVGDDYYMDGSVRQITPLSPALHFGARRILVIAVGQFSGQRPAPGARMSPAYPSFAQVAGHALSSIFLDNLGADLERLAQMNRMIGLLSPRRLARNGLALAHVDAMVLAPSRDIGPIALEHAARLPAGVRTLLRGFGSTRGTGANLVSYLLFDRDFCRALLAQGYADAMTRREELTAFLDARHAKFLPVFRPDGE